MTAPQLPLTRIVPVIAHAVAVFGDEHKASHWLSTPLPHFGNRAPSELLETEDGIRLVEQTLTQARAFAAFRNAQGALRVRSGLRAASVLHVRRNGTIPVTFCIEAAGAALSPCPVMRCMSEQPASARPRANIGVNRLIVL